MQRAGITKHPNDIDRHVAAEIRRRRIEAQLSQGELAAALGVSFQQLQKYENGSNRVSAGRLAQIASELGLPIRSFFPASDIVGSSDVVPEQFRAFLKDPAAIRLLTIWDRLAPRIVAKLVALAAELGKR